MSKKCSVRPLNEYALSELANCIVTAVGHSVQTEFESEVTITMVEINSYLQESGATSDIYQDLLRIILNSDYLEASVRFTCLQMLLNESVHCLITEIFPFSYYEKILQVIAAQGCGLRSLNLKGVWIKEDHMQYMYDIVRKLNFLNKLSIPYIANDDLLKHIGEYSRSLKYLDISGETDITDVGIESLSLGVTAQNLSVIDIGMLGEENICHTDIAMLLTHLPNLTTLVTYSFVGKSLLYIVEKENKPYFKCKLRNLHDTGTNLKTLDAIVSTCPELESLYLDTPENGILHKISSLKLVRLKLYKFCCNEFSQIIKSIGPNLLHLTVIKGRNDLDIGKIATNCSSLIDLDCYMMENLIYNSDCPKFENILGLELLNSPISVSSLKNFISRSTSLKRLAVDSVGFSDEDMIR